MPNVHPQPSALPPRADRRATPNPATEAPITHVEELLAALLLVLTLSWSMLPSGLSWNFNRLGEDLTGGSVVVQLQWTSLFVLAGALCLFRFEKFQQVIFGLNPFLVAILLFSLANASWSVLPIVTLKKVVQLIGLLMIAVALQVTEMSRTRWLKLAFGTLLAVQVASVLAVLLVPDIAIEYTGMADGAWEGGAWRGVTDQKNMYGTVTAYATFMWVCLFVSPKNRISPLLFLVVLGFCGFNLLMTKSTTSLLMATLSSGLFILLRRKYVADDFVFSRAFLIVGGLILIYLHVLYVVQGRLPTWDEFFKPVADLLGKRTDISGRFDIWGMVLEEIDKHPWLGVGFGAFWMGTGSASQSIIDRLYWLPFQAHNGYLDIYNELGIIGLGLFAGFILAHVITLMRLSRFSREASAFHGALLLTVMAHNVTESTLFHGLNLLFILVVFSSVAATTQLRRFRQREALPQG